MGSTSSSAIRTRAFTLVELLVVITIIGVLVAMLLPALGKARSDVMVTKCQAQQRGCGVAFLAYANDFNYFLPPAGCEDLPSKLYCQPITTYNGYPCPSDVRALGPYLFNTRIMMCPGFIGGKWIRTGSNLPYWFAWFNQTTDYWKNVGTGNGNWFGYLYLKSSYGPMMWEQRYGSLQETISFRLDGTYPVAAAYGGPTSANKLLILLSDIAYTSSFYAGWGTPIPNTPVDWDNFPHDMSVPRGGNFLRPDGSAKFYDLSVWSSDYNGFATMKWTMQ